ncbi:nucleotidyltransferase [Flavobacterium sp. GA093]|uniref:Nucleotidyltransferase n=1 Tax=Flavobacterium hydrocarbonoxydans TaxID=2683249 RepID=A0A6I4NRK2_9FLAO|nr:nucleotidyltransferase [Flavobacterium hydrocarbonoxydans]MWB96761.1 nucleotidyltransferase [Flavobacterium hydrocarbonoxydans]
MARSIANIQTDIIEALRADDTLKNSLTEITSTSKTSISRLITFVVATAIGVLEALFDQHKKEVDDKLANQKSGTLPWYRTMALRFQYGYDLVADEDYFDNQDHTTAQIEASKIVKYAAVNEAEESSRVIIKIAGESAGILAPINDDQREGFEAYIDEIKVAGVKVTVLNYKPDRLYLNILIKRNAMILDSSGMDKDTAKYPVKEAIQEFMKELPFDGDLRLSALVDKLQKVEGVLDATIVGAQSAWVDAAGPVDADGYSTPPQDIYISTIPKSGYFEIATFDNISYVV